MVFENSPLIAEKLNEEEEGEEGEEETRRKEEQLTKDMEQSGCNAITVHCVAGLGKVQSRKAMAEGVKF